MAPDADAVEVEDEIGVLTGDALEELEDAPLLMYELYDDEWAVERSAPKKSNWSCSTKSEAGSEGVVTSVVVCAT